VPMAVKIQGNRQLQRIERPQALRGSVVSRSFLASTEVEFDVIGTGLLVIQRRQRARVEKILCHSTFFAEIDDGFGKRTGDGGECASHFVERDVIVKRVDAFLGREVTSDVLSGIHGR
jgi:hypothetical protein